MTDKDLPKSQAEKNVEADAFDLVYRGEIAPGNSAEEVKQRVAASFNLDPAAADQLFSGTQIRLKRGIDKITAERILQRLTDAGAIALIVPSSGQPETARQDPLSLAPIVLKIATRRWCSRHRWIILAWSLLELGWLKRLKCQRLKLPIWIPLNSHLSSQNWPSHTMLRNKRQIALRDRSSPNAESVFRGAFDVLQENPARQNNSL